MKILCALALLLAPPPPDGKGEGEGEKRKAAAPAGTRPYTCQRKKRFFVRNVVVPKT